MFKNPNFKLQINASGLKYIVNVNGVTVLREFDSSNKVTVDLPINHWMHPDTSEFNYLVAPSEQGAPFSKDAFIEINLLVSQHDNPEVNYLVPLLNFDANAVATQTEMSKSPKSGTYVLEDNKFVSKVEGGVVLHDIEVIKSKETDIDFYEGAITYKRRLKLANNLPLWAFFNSDTLPDYDAMSDADYDDAVNEIFVEYAKIQDALRSKDIASIAHMFEERSREADAAFHYPVGQFQKETMEMLEEDINNPEFTLNERPPIQLKIVLEKNKKIVSLTTNNFSNALGFVRENGSYSSYPLMFRRQEGK